MLGRCCICSYSSLLINTSLRHILLLAVVCILVTAAAAA
jgi:hypothetical protein